MKTNLVAAVGACRLELRSSERASFTEYHLTATVESNVSARDAARELFAEVASVLLERKIQPIQEKLYGLSSARSTVLERRDAVYRQRGLDRTMPVTWIQGAPLRGSDFVGVQIWGIESRDGEPCVKTVENPITGRAREWSGRGFRMLHLPSVSGVSAPTAHTLNGHVAQAAQMFSNAGEALRAHDMKYAQVVRTWIYVKRLLEWYGDLNRVRTAYYHNAGIGVPGGVDFPASTGIQGHSGEEECTMDVLALESEGSDAARAFAIRRSPRQDASFNYGSAFSRGMAIEIEGRRTVHISGTASINAAGESTYCGDAEHQSLETLMSIAAILEEQGGSLDNITSATLFCKDRSAWEAWERVTRLLGLQRLPKICVLADVCRSDLLVEMEAVAVI